MKEETCYFEIEESHSYRGPATIEINNEYGRERIKKRIEEREINIEQLKKGEKINSIPFSEQRVLTEGEGYTIHIIPLPEQMKRSSKSREGNSDIVIENVSIDYIFGVDGILSDIGYYKKGTLSSREMILAAIDDVNYIKKLKR